MRRVLLSAVMTIPLNSAPQWQILQYRSIKPNRVEFSDVGLRIAVKDSASPVIHPLPKVPRVRAVRAIGEVKGGLQLSKPSQQGSEGFDDYQLRLGLVVKGTQRLNFLQKAIAADWIVKLFELAPKDIGVDHILFLNGTQAKELVGSQRVHPLSELMRERVLWQIPESGDFEFTHELAEPVEVLALWLSSDGDDTHSAYEILFKKIELTENP